MKRTVWIFWTLAFGFALGAFWLVGCKKVEQGQSAASPKKGPKIIRTKLGVEMVVIPGGWFEMGSRDGNPDEQPVHRVWVDGFLMDRFEVTQALYERLMTANPSHFKGTNRPVEQISWANAALFCNMRSRAEGLEPCYDEETGECNYNANGYRLPTEAEWEYACRAGTTTRYFFGQDPRQLKLYAWYADNSEKRTHPVGQKRPNPWGLYDMYGNVAEWCNDMYASDYYAHSPTRNPHGPKEGKRYVLRGGSWKSSADACRSAARFAEDPGFEDACFARDTIGFRCVRKLPPELMPNPPQTVRKKNRSRRG